MTRKLIYTPDAAGEYTIAEESENWVTVIGQVENESDARLFCAAPDLLEALKWAMTRIGNYTNRTSTNGDYCDAVDRAYAAIAKATGETK